MELTPAGRKLAAQLGTMTERAAEAVLERIPRTKRRQVLESMRLIRSALEKSREDTSLCRLPDT